MTNSSFRTFCFIFRIATREDLTKVNFEIKISESNRRCLKDSNGAAELAYAKCSKNSL